MTERVWEAPTAAGSVIDQWAAVAPELAGKVKPVRYEPATRQLDLLPVSPAHATHLRLLGRQLIARINAKTGQETVKEPCVLAPGQRRGGPGRLSRLLAVRDGDSPEQLEHVANWLLEELPFMLREQPWARAAMIVAGPPQIDHDPDTELVVAPSTRTTAPYPVTVGSPAATLRGCGLQ
ncbi:DciA family protein [Streptomyces sp. NPDC002838]|uniref:DciA family protein n=1 Tax=Streptomyces sp. NPDC002838 TaxID=3154436 RepID=UPI003326C7DF